MCTLRQIMVIKSSRTRQAGNVTRMGEMKKCVQNVSRKAGMK